MNKSVVTQYQPSITEWFASIGQVKEANAFRAEDNIKVFKSETLYQTIGLPYERPEKLPATELANCGSIFTQILCDNGDELCAIRLVPKKEGLPKLRDRGQSIKNCYENWFKKQLINYSDYDVYICPHCDSLVWSAIFVVKKDIIFGEIIKGMHSQLTQGNTTSKSCQFIYDFKSWQWSNNNIEAQNQVNKMIKMICVKNTSKRESLIKSLNSKFTHNHLMGYFETTVWPGNKTYFIDYNRLLPDYISDPPNLNDLCTTCEVGFDFSKVGIGLKGATAYSGIICGKVVLVDDNNLNSVIFPAGSILVCDNTDVRYLPLMKKTGAIVTNRGGILSHASIIARELKKPCIIGTRIATKVLRDGDLVEVDANKGIIKKL